MLDTETGELVNLMPWHEGNEVREFYSQLPRPVLVGIEATGSTHWFLSLMEELGIECRVGHPAVIRRQCVLAADLSMSQFVPLSAYEFNDESAPEDFLPPVTFPYDAAHGSELQYLFAFLHTPFTLPQQKLSATMQHYWTSFAKFGSPNSATTPFWQPFNPLQLNFQSLVPPTPAAETNFAIFHHCAFWGQLLGAQ